MTFLGENYINYEILRAGVVPLKRRRRQEITYITAQNLISLSFLTDQPSGSLFQLGDPQGGTDYLLLKVCMLCVLQPFSEHLSK